MGYRLTNNEKWRDTWFNELSSNAKLLFIYMYEKCDDAGFFEHNLKFLIFDLGFTDAELRKCYPELKKCYIKSNDGWTIWIKHFLKHQKKLPLNPNNNAHKKIIKLINNNLNNEDKFKDCDLLEFMLPDVKNEVKLPVGNSEPQVKEIKPPQKRKKRTFKKPTIQEIKEYMDERKFPNSENEATYFFDYYESIGWKVGKKDMVNWKNTVNTWINKKINPLNTSNFVKPTQIEVMNYMKDMEFIPAEVESKKFYNWFESNGWKVGKNKMENWKNSINSWISNWHERTKIVNKSSKLDVLKQSHDLLKEIDWNDVYNI